MTSPPNFGVGFRTPHFETIAAGPQPVDWFEIITESFLGVGGPRRAILARLRADYPVILHGVGLSIAGAEPLASTYLDNVRALAAWVEPAWVSDHLCWTGRYGRTSHDLLPVAYTHEVLAHVAARVEQVQDVLQRRLLLENPSAYVAFRAADMDEATFFSALCARTGCGMLLDVNNLYVNAVNLGIDLMRYLDAMPADCVGYMHVAGHAVLPDVRIDTHDTDVSTAGWELFEAAVRRCPAAGVIIERDNNLPAFTELLAELGEARARHAAARESPANISVDHRLGGRPQPHGSRQSLAGRRAGVPPAGGGRTGGTPAPRRTDWAALQEAFWQHVVDKPVGFDHAAAGSVGDWLEDRAPVAAARGLRVYSDAYAVNLQRALRVNFPALARVVSAADFDALAAAYVRVHPPCGHDFRELRAQLPAFVRSYPFADAYGVDRDVLADLVAVEQAQIEVLDAVDEPPGVSPAEVAGFDAAQWETVRFCFARALRVVAVSHDVLPVIEAVGRGETPARPTAMAGAYLVSRDGTGLRTERLRPHEATILTALLAGVPFAAACETAVPAGSVDASTVAADAVRLLVTGCQRGVVLARVGDVAGR